MNLPISSSGQSLEHGRPIVFRHGIVVTMDDAHRIRITQRGRGLTADIEQVPERKRLFAGEQRGHAVAVDVLHGGAELSFDFAGAIQHNNVRVR